MKKIDDDNFIDKIVKDSLKDFKQPPETNWEKMKDYLADKNLISKKYLKNKYFSGPQNIILTAIGALALVSAIYLSTEKTNRLLPETEKIKKENLTDTLKNKKVESETKNIDKEPEKEKNTNSEIKNKKDVKIKVTVPVHKKVIIKKQIILNDSTNNN